MLQPQNPPPSEHLERSSWKAEAIRRGEIKISGPIALTDDDDDEHELAKPNTDSFPKRSDSIAARNLLHKKSLTVPVTAPAAATDREDRASGVQDSPPRLPHKRASTAIRDMGQMQKPTSPDLSAAASHSNPSPFAPSRETSSASNMVPKKRRKSGLRSVIRKMFGRRSKDEIKRDSVQRHGYHRSDPGVLSAAQSRSKEDAARARSKSDLAAPDNRISTLPVRELKPLNPLGSHLPFPMNVNAPEEASPSHDYLTFEHPMLPRRRATLPSVVFSGSEVAALSAIWNATGAKGKPWADGTIEDSIPSPEIGIALSSPTHAKRRSRSAGALRELSRRPDSIPRRRSAEIKYWRTSGMARSVSVYSTATARPTTGDGADEKEAIEEREPSLPDETTSLPPTAVDENEAVHSQALPTAPFNFGALKSSFSESHDDMTDAANSPGPLPLEDRVKRLESGMQVLEQSLHRLTGRSHRQTIILENAPKGRRTRSTSTIRDPDTSPARSLTSLSQSRKSSKSSKEVLASEPRDPSGPPSPSLPPTFLTSPSTAGSMMGKERVASAPLPSSQSLSQAQNQNENATHPSSADQIAAVSTILRHERAARKALEKTVLALQREVAELRALVRINVHAYPTPSPDGILTHEEHVVTPRAYRGHRGLGFDGADGMPKERVVSRFSRSESEGGDGDDEGDEDMMGVQSPEVWATPKEEVGREFFGRGEGDGEGEDEMF